MAESQETKLAELDRSILELLAQRIELFSRLPRSERNVQQQAAELLQTATEGLLGKQLSPDVLHIVSRTIAGVCALSSSKTPLVAYLGPQFSYSYLATVRYFSETAVLVPVATIGAVFEDVLAERADYGVVPIENSTDGRVIDTLSTFADSPLGITGEVVLPIHHCLLSQEGTDQIRSVHSKPQALSQCRKWLAMHLPNAKLVECSSTTAAVEIACQDSSAAAIASYEAGIHYGLNVTARNVEDSRNNVTRFAVIGRRRQPATGNDKTSLMFQIPHRAGSLADVLVTFQSFGINLTWIESFPIRGNPNEYLFFVEFDGHQDQKNVASAIEKIAKHSLRFECLGSYPKAVASK
jgi:chorismate mutase/prephenate dehydratase